MLRDGLTDFVAEIVDVRLGVVGETAQQRNPRPFLGPRAARVEGFIGQQTAADERHQVFRRHRHERLGARLHAFHGHTRRLGHGVSVRCCCS